MRRKVQGIKSGIAKGDFGKVLEGCDISLQMYACIITHPHLQDFST